MNDALYQTSILIILSVLMTFYVQFTWAEEFARGERMVCEKVLEPAAATQQARHVLNPRSGKFEKQLRIAEKIRGYRCGLRNADGRWSEDTVELSVEEFANIQNVIEY